MKNLTKRPLAAALAMAAASILFLLLIAAPMQAAWGMTGLLLTELGLLALALGLTDGYMQEKSSAREEYTPPFDGEGL